MTTTNVLPRLLTTAEAAAILNIKPRALKDHWRNWGLPAIKVGRELRFRESDILAYIDRRAA